MPDPTDALYEVRLVVRVERALTDDELGLLGDECGQAADNVRDLVVYDLGLSPFETDVESHGPSLVIA